MDKTWVYHPRTSKKYLEGARNFVHMVQSRTNSDQIICPCARCVNLCHLHVDLVYEHLVIKGMSPTYTTWIWHGEDPPVHVQHGDRKISKRRRMHRDAYDGDFKNVSHKTVKKPEDVEAPLYVGKKATNRVDVRIHAYSKKGGTASSEEVTQPMEKIEECRTQSSDASHTNGDVRKHIYESEHPGRVLAGGFGVAPSQMDLDISNMENQIAQLVEKYDELKSIILKSQHNCQMNKTADGGCSSNNIENARCKLLVWTEMGDVVGEGKITSIDPHSQVHGVAVGPDCWKLSVTVALVDLSLYRPTREFHVLNDAVGSNIAWPKKYVLLD